MEDAVKVLTEGLEEQFTLDEGVILTESSQKKFR